MRRVAVPHTGQRHPLLGAADKECVQAPKLGRTKCDTGQKDPPRGSTGPQKGPDARVQDLDSDPCVLQQAPGSENRVGYLAPNPHQAVGRLSGSECPRRGDDGVLLGEDTGIITWRATTSPKRDRDGVSGLNAIGGQRSLPD